MICGIKKIYNFDPYSVFLAIATNIPQRLKTGVVVQGHICVTCAGKTSHNELILITNKLLIK